MTSERFGIADGLTILRKHAWLLVVTTAFMVLLIAAPRAMRPRMYSATAGFIPQATQPGSNLAGFAAQFGIDVGARQPGQSPEFYAEYVSSRPVLRRAVESKYVFRSGGATREIDLVEFYETAGASRREQIEAAVDELQRNLSVGISRQSGVVRLELRARNAWMSRQILSRLIELVNEFNVETRQSQAALERQFIEARLRETEAELRRSENALQIFLQRNRQFQNSPAFAFEHERLERDMRLRGELYASVMQAYEQARVQEVRNTPVVTVVERPEVPTRPVPRRLGAGIVLGLVMGLVFGAIAAFTVELAPLLPWRRVAAQLSWNRASG
jgi:uncharacterized protein involved in exopolysaccharide biosynthesis